MTAQNTPYGQVESFEGSVLLNGLTGILRAGGGESAGGWGEGGDALLVEEDGQ